LSDGIKDHSIVPFSTVNQSVDDLLSVLLPAVQSYHPLFFIYFGDLQKLMDAVDWTCATWTAL